jgi:ribosome modulation factor
MLRGPPSRHADRVLSPADQQAAEGRQTGRLGRPISDCPAQLGGELRRAWRAGWRLGHDEHVAGRETWEAGVGAYGGSAPRRRAA